MSEISDRLEVLSATIRECRVCDRHGLKVKHSQGMKRGDGRDVMVIGVEPGNTELEIGEAFSGLSGRRLVGWLQLAGLGETRERVLARSHLTSICKCKIGNASERPAAARNCFHFLQEQVEVVSPRIVLTLGLEPLRFLFDSRLSLEDAVARSWKERDLMPSSLFPLLPSETVVIPLPHPSPLSRWLNTNKAQQLLQNAIERLQSEISKCDHGG